MEALSESERYEQGVLLRDFELVVAVEALVSVVENKDH